MKAITIRLKESTIESLDSEAAEHDRSRSEHIREVIRTRHEHEDLKAEHERLQQQVDRLQREKRMILERDQETTDLVRVAEKQTDWIEKRAKAGLLTKTKWAIFGMPDEKQEEES